MRVLEDRHAPSLHRPSDTTVRGRARGLDVPGDEG
jgi:hypothetical protein